MPYDGPSPAEVLQMRKDYVNPAIFHYYKKPVMIVEGKGQYLYDETGRRYLDGFGGIVTVSVGHCHPEVVKAAHLQNETIQHTTTIYLNPGIALYAKELAAKMPGDLKVCYFVNSGSEANDLAVLMARAYTGNYDLVALRNAYHGGSPGTMALTSHHTWKFNVPHSFGVQHARMPDLYRGPYGVG
jgi:alanine-glyoxylate transaminase / (R)-3-amino-2-methylpropionate-pyruvate transaminase